MEQLRFPVTRADAEKTGLKYLSGANKKALFPSRLRELRKEAHLTQKNFAKQLGISKSTLSMYENGDTLPDIETADKMATVFAVSTDYLLRRTDISTPNAEIRAICEMTGLSENTINNLVLSRERWPVFHPQIADLVNLLLCDESLADLIIMAQNIDKLRSTGWNIDSNQIKKLADEMAEEEIAKDNLGESALVTSGIRSRDFILFETCERLRRIIFPDKKSNSKPNAPIKEGDSDGKH